MATAATAGWIANYPIWRREQHGQQKPPVYLHLPAVGSGGSKCFFATVAEVGEVGFHASLEAAAS
jgi:hypothetical protein